MRARLFACLGVFAVMALSNVIVPDLPTYATGTTLQGSIYAAYFLGAFLITLPAGLLSDRYGRVQVMRGGILLTVISGLFLFVASEPLLAIGARLLEGFGAGLFVAASMAYVNSLQDHQRMSGYLMASLNTGLVIGLIAGGFLATYSPYPSTGVLLFTVICCCLVPLSSGLVDPMQGITPMMTRQGTLKMIGTLVSGYRWLWYSAVVLIGVTGVITSLYPELSGAPPDVAGLWIAAMSVATILAVLAVSKINLPPVPTIRMAAMITAGGVMISFYSPAGFLLIGALAGVVMIAQMAFLSTASDNQGAAMGLFSTTSYLGMSLLPFLTGIIAERATFFIAFCVTACAALSVSLTIDRCSCRNP